MQQSFDLWKIIIVVVGLIITIIMGYVLSTISIFLTIIFSIFVAGIIFYYLFKERLSISQNIPKRPELPFDKVKSELVKQYADEYGLRVSHIPKLGRGLAKQEEKFLCEDFHFTGAKHNYNFRGDWFMLVEVFIKQGLHKGYKTYQINMSKTFDKIKAGNITCFENDISTTRRLINHQKFAPAPFVSRFAQGIAEILPFVSDPNQAIELATSRGYGGGYYDSYSSPPIRSRRSRTKKSGSPPLPPPYQDYG